ncbi:MAG: crossover junction endodeoxyribonuclease RuvC [Candidatus Staskawiczbacteria bacterium RIFCSPLOWO2_01_FULL_40_39]|uniref:Crossover junction endodeoxyribonuclease RuvC n=1 Tax=Candidatus Staskawiczbacteria bacterium RIFCSPHIGHO2_01_FULL_39_25 TaxID=1802202 RepID=A0A1G2HMM3_9BACT|nr:MAG: crossover junction endodeoxyribonuclease RuvC [Candidatus Staskawiczbacteria bacterium RIFCSPHIGHO2_01_FULL_39_25]OGZ73193.1 MAG: crossover junction endodeoxyribonuclease RuvC [Candidatus Staskawiczbacteria bacterium RIFCSPLOWO2_01_FULL_40_39]OGZ76011.1 MAG: crossover junction endodeoxyribonuclease RuvC [Candidatus Staskawiczbacteria bacterium RIFCSPLOWO2_02_FULL_39_8]
MIILGIDPGTAIVGYGVITTKIPKHLPQDRNEKPKVVDFGCITTTAFDSPGERLKIIHNAINKLIEKHKPDIMSVESLYFFKNFKTAMPVSQAKGVILLAAAKKNIPTLEFTPLQVKMTVVGYGKAEKKQVQEMTKELLDLSSFNLKEKSRKKDDAADALGIALCAVLKGVHG